MVVLDSATLHKHENVMSQSSATNYLVPASLDEGWQTDDIVHLYLVRMLWLSLVATTFVHVHIYPWSVGHVATHAQVQSTHCALIFQSCEQATKKPSNYQQLYLPNLQRLAQSSSKQTITLSGSEGWGVNEPIDPLHLGYSLHTCI